MADLVYADAGALVDLGKIFNNISPSAGNNLLLDLFINDVTPSDASTASSFTIASGGGYAQKTLTAGSWVVSSVDGIPTASYALQKFEFTGALTGDALVYGYLVRNQDLVLKFAQRLSAIVKPAVSGNYIDVTPIYKLSKGTPS